AAPRAAEQLDALRAHHRPGDLPVQPALCGGDGRVPRPRQPRARRALAACRAKGGRPMSRLFTRLFMALVALVLAAPIVVVAGVSFNAQRTLTFPPVGFSLAWFGEVFTDAGWRGALLTSLAIAAGSAALAVAIAFPLAWFLWRWHAPWARLFQALGTAPFILPPVITALGFLSFWATAGFYGAPWTVVISHAIFLVTLPLVTITLGFSSIDRSLTEAAATMGADDRTVLRTVVLPLVTPY